MQAVRTPQLELLFERLSELTTLPSLAVRIVNAACDSTIGSAELESLVECDPVLVARLMRVANSSFYSQSRQVDTIRRAITLLGNKRLANLALTVIVARQFHKQSSSTALNRDQLWLHSAAVASISELLCTELKVGDPEQAYLAGLLHDFSFLVIDQLLSKHVPAIVEEYNLSGDLHAAVRTVLPFTPSELSSYFAMRAELPDTLVDGIAYHADPEAIPTEPWLADVIHFADYLSHRHHAGIFRGRSALLPGEGTIHRLGIDEDFLRSIWNPIEERLEAIQQFSSP